MKVEGSSYGEDIHPSAPDPTDRQTPPSWWKRQSAAVKVLAVIVGLAVVGAVAGACAAEAGQKQTTVPTTTYSDGTYLVGTDLPAGLYKGVTNGASGYWGTSKDASFSQESMVATDRVEGQFYVEVRKGQFLELESVTIADARTVKVAAPATEESSDGMYLVGTDIVAGRYSGTLNGDLGFWSIAKDASGTNDSIVASDAVFGGPFDIEVKKGQYLTLNGVAITISK